MDESRGKYRLSVVISTVNPPSTVARSIQPLIAQVAAVGGELIIISGAKNTALPGIDNVRVHAIPGASVFDCRAAALRIASGDIIALTEDHCVQGKDWCTRILKNFAERPDLVLLGGAVANASTERIEDLMNYWMTFATFAPGQVVARHPCVAQFIVKAERLDGPIETGELEDRLIKKFELVPGAIHIDPELQVRHVQSHGFCNTFLVHYHNGRATGGFSVRRTSGRNLSVWQSLQWAWIDALAHLRRTARAFAIGGKSAFAVAGYCCLILPLVATHCIGEFVGYRSGPGKSPRYLG